VPRRLPAPTSGAGRSVRALLALLACALLLAPLARASAQGGEAAGAGRAAASHHPVTIATGFKLRVDGPETLFSLQLTAGPGATVVVVADPVRVIVDMADVEFRLPPGAGQAGQGLVTSFRFGLLGPRQSRLVLDASGPVRIQRAEVKPSSGGAFHLEIVLAAIDEAGFRAALAASQSEVQALRPARHDGQSHERPTGTGRTRPVVVIDPGHGGVDPGAVGAGGVLEKAIVLAVARSVAALLASGGRYTPVLTRAGDTFLTLDQRVQIADEVEADLFISLHADAVAATDMARAIRGATVYTLSDRASDEQARRLAEKENASDLLAGIGAAVAEEAGDVRDILIDLMRRETANFSADASQLLVNGLKGKIALAPKPRRSAAFRVLKQPRTPAVLIELGYMSNPQDQALMTTPEWQQKVAGAIAGAVEAFLARRLAQTGGR
jgi:N-acetylmuramoyl-L-alanine amidase